MSQSSADLPTSILFCRLCQSLYRQPRTLPCLHSFCLDCLLHLAPCHDSQGHSTLNCPLCNQEAPLPPDGVSALTCNEFLARMCQEYVGEVQKTLVTSRSSSPAGSVRRQGPVSPSSIIAGRAPSSHSQYSVFQSSSPSPSMSGIRGYGQRPLSPSQIPKFDQFFHGRQSYSEGSPSHQSTPASSSPGYLSPSCMPSSPYRSRTSSTSSSSDIVLQTARRLSSEVLPSRGIGVQRRLSSTPQDVVHTWESLQRKLNSLQSASLQVTYSLETVNMAETNWHQRKQDLKRDVQRRSAQLQFFIKRQERLLLAALDAKKTDDGFNTAVEEARNKLRTNLKALMHEIDFIRSVLDLATDSEITSLSGLLLNSKVSQIPVNMETPELRFMVPDEMSLEDMVRKDFGCLTSTPVEHCIFTPEDMPVLTQDTDDDAFSVETHSIHSASSDGTLSPTVSSTFEEGYDDVAYIDDDEEEVVVEETLEIIDGKMQVISKSSAPSSSTQSKFHGNQQNKHKDSKEQSTRGRGTDVRRTANSSATTPTAKEDTFLVTSKKETSKIDKETSKHDKNQASQTRKSENNSQSQSSDPQSTIDKFQSLRESLKQKRRELLLNTSVFPSQCPPGMAHLLRGGKRVQSLDRAPSTRRSFSPPPLKHQVPSVAAPVIHTPTHSASRKDIVSDVASVSDEPVIGEDTSVMSISATSLTSPTSPTRPVRRAISAASDKASKMEYLRETWRKRKQLLKENETYFTNTDSKPEDEKSPTDLSPTDSSSQNSEGNTTSPTGHKSKIKQSIRSRISNLKHALKKNTKGEEAASESKSHNKSPDKIITDEPVSPTLTAAQAAAEKKVLKTIEGILQKKNVPSIKTETKSPTSVQPQVSVPESPPSACSKPSMLVKPCPRLPPSATTLANDAALPLETLQEDSGNPPEQVRKIALRVTSPVRGDPNREKLQQVRANIRQKKERWRSLSLH